MEVQIAALSFNLPECRGVATCVDLALGSKPDVLQSGRMTFIEPDCKEEGGAPRFLNLCRLLDHESMKLVWKGAQLALRAATTYDLHVIFGPHVIRGVLENLVKF